MSLLQPVTATVHWDTPQVDSVPVTFVGAGVLGAIGGGIYGHKVSKGVAGAIADAAGAMAGGAVGGKVGADGTVGKLAAGAAASHAARGAGADGSLAATAAIKAHEQMPRIVKLGAKAFKQDGDAVFRALSKEVGSAGGAVAGAYTARGALKFAAPLLGAALGAVTIGGLVHWVAPVTARFEPKTDAEKLQETQEGIAEDRAAAATELRTASAERTKAQQLRDEAAELHRTAPKDGTKVASLPAAEQRLKLTQFLMEQDITQDPDGYQYDKADNVRAWVDRVLKNDKDPDGFMRQVTELRKSGMSSDQAAEAAYANL